MNALCLMKQLYVAPWFVRSTHWMFAATLLVFAAACDTVTPPSHDDTVGTPVTLSVHAPASGGAAKAAKAADLTDDAGNALTLDRVEMVLRAITFERDEDDEAMECPADDDTCEEVERGPVLVTVPLDEGVPDVLFETALPEGTWEEVAFEVHKLDDDDADDRALLDETGFPEDVSIRVTGTWAPAGGTAQTFTYTSDLNEEKEIEFEPPLDVTADAPKNITLSINVDTWFRQSNGMLVNPAEGTDDGRYEDLIEDNIERSIEGYEDDDRDGKGDHDADDGNDDGDEDGDDDRGDDDNNDDGNDGDDDDEESAASFESELSGDHEVPAVETDAEGEVEFDYNRTSAELTYEIELEDIEEVTQAHIHLGGPDENGPVVATLLRFTENVDGSGGGTPFTAEDDDYETDGTLTAEDIIARDGFDGSLDALIRAMREGNAYVNVHTVQNPTGEIRGQIEADDDGDDGDDDDD